MIESPDESVAQLEEQLDGISRMLSDMEALNARQAERVAARMDQIASQLLEITAPPTTDEVNQRLSVSPAGTDDFQSLLPKMSAADGEG